MKIITVNEKNITSVYGKVKNFFQNKNHTGFEAFHNYDCGFHKVKPMEDVKNPIREYPDVLEVKLLKFLDKWKIDIKLTAMSMITIQDGDKIAFLGNRIIHKDGDNFPLKRYQYTVFTQKEMSMETCQKLHKDAYKERMAYERKRIPERKREWEEEKMRVRKEISDFFLILNGTVLGVEPKGLFLQQEG